MSAGDIEYTSNGVPLDQYVLTRRDRGNQRTAEAICDHAEEAAQRRQAEEEADPDLRARRLQLAQKVVARFFSKRTPDEELMRWTVRLYCGHLAEKVCHSSLAAPNMHGRWSMTCPICEMEPALIVAWEPIGLCAEPAAGDAGPVRKTRRAPRRR